MWRYLTLRLAASTIRWLPSAPAVLLVSLFADITHLFARKTRSIVECNLRHIVGDSVTKKSLRQMTREAFRNLFLNYYDLLRVPRVTLDEIERFVNFDGVEYFDQAQRYGRGVVLASAHIGNLDMVPQTLLVLRLKAMILAEQLRPPRLHDYVMGLRRAHGLSYEPVSISGIKAAFRALGRGEFVGIACDRAIQGQGIVTEFLGEPALMPVGAAELALRTGATVLPIFIIRTAKGQYKVYLEQPILVSKGNANADGVRDLTDRIIKIMERYIQKYPTQWMVFEHVWEQDKPGTQAAKERYARREAASGCT